MKAKQVTYSKLFNLGNYENEKIEISLEVEPGEDAAAVMQFAREYVQQQHDLIKLKAKYEEAKEIVSNPDNYYGHAVKRAQEFIQEFENKNQLLLIG